MKIILKHILKNMYEKKLRTCIILITILLSTMVVFIGLSLNDILNSTYSTMVKGAYGDGNVLITKATNEETTLYRTEDFEADAASIENRVDMIQAVGMSEKDGEDVKISLTGLDLDKASEMNVIDPIEQKNNFKLTEEEALISARTASNYDLDVGDPFTVEINNHAYTYTIAAISKSTGLYYSEMDDIILIVSKEQVNEIYGTENLITSSLLKIDNNKLETTVATLTDNNTNFSVQQTGQLDTVMRDEETFQTTVIIAIVIIVMISAYVILSLSKVIVSERMPTVGTFRSVGATKRLINRMLRIEFLFYGIIGAAIGLLLAFLLLPVAADSFNEYKEYGVETAIQYNFIYVAIAFVFGAIFPVFVGMLHIYRANKQPLKEIILNTSHTVQERSKKAAIIGVTLLASSLALYFFNNQDKLLLALISILCLFIAIVLLMPMLLNGISRLGVILLEKVPKGEVKLAIKNIANNKFVSSNVSMILVVFLLLLMIGVTSAGIDQYINKSVQQDFDVLITDPEMDFSNYEDLETIDGVSEVFMQHISGANYVIYGEQDTFIVYGVDDLDEFDEFYSGAMFFDNSKSELTGLDNGVIIDSYQAERYDLDVGDTIILEPLDKDFQPLEEGVLLELEVAGTMDALSLTSNRDIAIISLNYFQNHFVSTFNQIEVKASTDVDAKMVKANIENHYPYSDIQVQTFKELIESQKATVDTLIEGILIIILLGLVIGLLGISNNLLVSFNERKKEYAILYSICMSRSQLIFMLFYEMIMTFLSVVTIGFVGGLAMNRLWSKLLYAVGLKLDFSFNYELFFILCGAVLVLLALSSLFIIRKVAGLNVLSELRYE